MQMNSQRTEVLKVLKDLKHRSSCPQGARVNHLPGMWMVSPTQNSLNSIGKGF